MGNCAGVMKENKNKNEIQIDSKERQKPKETPYTRIAILGSKNTGKSTFFEYLFPNQDKRRLTVDNNKTNSDTKRCLDSSKDTWWICWFDHSSDPEEQK